MSGAQTSSFYPVNQLLVDNAQQIQNQYAPQRNELFVQRAQQEIGGTEIEMLARGSQSLLALGDEAKMAEAYTATVAELQRYGFAQNAPSVFPGKARLEQIAAMGTSSEKQAELTSNAATMRALTGGGPAPGGVTPVAPTTTDGAVPAPAASGVLPPTPQLAPVVAPGGAKFSVAAPHAERFQALVNDLEAAGYKINPDQSGGYNRRFIAGTQTPSNHASGAAIDINWTANARGGAGDIPPELARSLAAKHGLVWGGDWTGASRDPMHFEVAGQQQPVAAPGGSRVQVASATPTVATDGTVAPPGAVAPVVQPAAPVAAPAGPALVRGTDFTADQARQLAVFGAARGTKPADYLAMQERFRAANRADAAAARSEGQQAQSLQIQRAHLVLSEDANRRANQELAEKARLAGETFVPGTGIEAVHENTVQKYAAKVAKGQQLTDDEQRLYDGAYYALQQTGGQTGVMTDPNNAGQQIPFQTTRRLSPSLPEPKGGALPAVISQPGAAKKEAVSTEQSKAAGFADRVQQALPIIEDTSPAAMSRWQQLLGQVPLAGNSLVTPEFQLHMQAERNFINAVLRRESGMAIGKDEFVNARQQYIPQPGDSPQVLAQKKQNRETQLAGIIRDAGPSYKPATTPNASATAPAGTPPPPPGFKVIQ